MNAAWRPARERVRSAPSELALPRRGARVFLRQCLAILVIGAIGSASSAVAAAPKKKGAPAAVKRKPAGKKGGKGKKADDFGDIEAGEAESPETIAHRRKTEGDQAMQEKRYADALLAYDSAYAASPMPALLYNRARAEELSEHFPEALALLEEFKAKAPKDLLAKVPQLDDLISSVRSHVASVAVRVNVEGAMVKLRGATLGTAPLPAAVRVATGKAHLEATRDGYETATADVDLTPLGSTGRDEPQVIELALTRIVKPTTLVIQSSVRDANASIDGTGVGSPPVRSAVEPGAHAIEVSRAGYSTARMRVSLAEGDTREVRLDPQKEPGLTSKWWFWTGLGVVAVGGAAVATALLVEKDAGRGSIAPGQVSAGLHF